MGEVAASEATSMERVLREAKIRKRGIQRAIIMWAKSGMRHFPWRSSERTPYSVLIAEVLLKRTTSTAVLRVYPDFLLKFPNIDSIVEADESRLRAILSKIGLQEQRTKGLKDMANFISEEYEGHIPNTLGALTRIPHVGPYAACAVLSFGFGIPAPIVDSNVIRIISRLFASQNVKFVEKLCWKIAWELVPKEGHESFNWGLLDLGAMICTFKEAFHERCPLRMMCDTGKAHKLRSKD